MSSGTRRHARYAVNLRLRLQFAAGELETTTDEISLAGFSAPCPSLPEVGTSFGFVVHLPDGTTVTGTAAAMRIAPDGLAGFSCEFPPGQQAAWEAFVQQERAAGGVWRMLARYALGSGDDQATRDVREHKPRHLLPRAGDRKPEDEASVAARLHMVGENGEAYRLAFEKHPWDKPEASPFVTALPGFVELARRAVARVLGQDVYLKRAPHADIAPVRLVELAKGGYGYVVTHANAKPSLMGLHGSELILIEVDGQSVFPFFTPEELELIAHDTFRREVEDAAPAAPAAVPLREERFSAAYAHKEVDTHPPPASTQVELVDAMGASQRVQTRRYGSRTLKLFPDVWLEVRVKGERGALRGFAMEDGPSLCVFVMVGQGAPRVMRLEPTHVISLIRGAKES